MLGVVFIELEHNRLAQLNFALPSGWLTDRNSGVSYAGPNQAINGGDFEDRVPAYELDSGGRAGDDNAWCNLRCSGCHRPLQASRWYLFDHLGGFGGRGTGVSMMRRPENSLGRFVGSRGTEIDNAGLRPKTPLLVVVPKELTDSECWLGVKCVDMAEFYGIPRERFE